MNKHELVIALSEELSLMQTQCLDIVNAWEKILTKELCADKRVILQGFGSFSIWNQTPRMGRNPRTGEACPIEARVSVKFKPGKFLLDSLNREPGKEQSVNQLKRNKDEDI
ncbi:MAG: HU family DNA-binding protein [Parabacteroides gordonii]|nr:HU family DNA-binding protein [Parabacteroides gordonii]